MVSDRVRRNGAGLSTGLCKLRDNTGGILPRLERDTMPRNATGRISRQSVWRKSAPVGQDGTSAISLLRSIERVVVFGGAVAFARVAGLAGWNDVRFDVLSALGYGDVTILSEAGLRISETVVAAVEVAFENLAPFLFRHSLLAWRGLHGAHAFYIGALFVGVINGFTLCSLFLPSRIEWLLGMDIINR